MATIVFLIWSNEKMAVEHSKKYNKQKKTCLDQNQFLIWHSSQKHWGIPVHTQPNLDTRHFQPGLDWPGRRKSKGSVCNLTSFPALGFGTMVAFGLVVTQWHVYVNESLTVFICSLIHVFMFQMKCDIYFVAPVTLKFILDWCTGGKSEDMCRNALNF